MVPGRGPRAKAKVPAGGGPEAGVGVGGRGAVGRGAGAGGSGGTAGAGGQAGNRPPGGGALPADGGQGGRRGGQGRAFLPRASLEVRENTACLHMEGFQVLPTEEEYVQWLEDEVFKDEWEVLTLVLEGFRHLNVDNFGKKMLMTLTTETQLQAFLSVMNKEGEPEGRLWPGLEHEVRVRAEAMSKRSMEITVMDVDPESDKELVRRAMEKYGEVRRCERMNLPGRWSRVKVNKVKVELVRNDVKLPNIIHAFGTAASADDFTTWKLQYRGCARYCYGCGATSHEARQCTEKGITKEKLEKVASVVGEEEIGEAPLPELKLSYAAVIKDPTFLARQRREKEVEAQEARRRVEQEAQEKERRSARREKERQERISQDMEVEGVKRARLEREARARLEQEQRSEEDRLERETERAQLMSGPKQGEAGDLERARQEMEARAQLEQGQSEREAQLEQEQKREESQPKSAPKEQKRGREERPPTKEALLERDIVRNRSDSLGRKGAGKRLASPTTPDPVAPGAQAAQKAVRVASPPYNFAKAIGAPGGKKVPTVAAGSDGGGENK